MDTVASSGTASTPPKAQRRPLTTTHHGIAIVDDYAWLRADNWQEVMRDPSKLDGEIRSYLEAENAYCAARLAQTDDLQSELFAEMKARIKADDKTVPAPDGPHAYFYQFVPGGQYPQLCRCDRDGGNESVLLDGNAEAEGNSYWQMGGSAHSPDHKLLAFAVDDKGSELYTIKIRDLATGKDLIDEIPNTHGDMAWARDGRTLYYVQLDDNHRPLTVLRHAIGTPVKDDTLVYQEHDTGFYVGLSQTQSTSFILIVVHDHQTSEVHLLDASIVDAEPICVAKRVTGHEYGVEHNDDRLIIMTNSQDAEDVRIVETPVDDPAPSEWREIVAHKPGRLILDTVVYRDYMVRLEREDGLPRLVVTSLSDNTEHAIAFDEEAYALGLSAGYEFDTSTLRFTYASMTTPSEVYDYDMETRTRVLRKRQEVPSGHNSDDYVARRIFAPTKDGDTVPISLLYHKSTPLDGSAPVFLYGYGAYGISMPASFSTGRLSLVDRGFIFAIAHVRGGKEKGYRWYKNGKLAKKTNTFHDFVAAGEHLVAKGFTKRGNIVANGGSAGGMLMGVIANIAPELFLGIIADVPFVDVLNTMLDKDLPLTPPEWPEWGDPISSKEQFDSILAYSPYDNVSAQAYPHILVNAGLSDPRVTYWEPAKWVARLRERNTSDNMILLRTNMEAGHGGASGRFEQLKETAINYSFALLITGKAKGTQT